MNYELLETKSKVHKGCLRVFHKNSHNAPIKKYSLELLKYLLVDNNINGIDNKYSEMIKYNINRNWLLACLNEDEDENDFELKLIMEEKKYLENGETPDRWLKCCLLNNKTGLYHLRSISNDNKSEYGKRLKKSKNLNWFIDEATLLADRSFWQELKNLFV